MIRLSEAQAKKLLGTKQPKKPPKPAELAQLPDGHIRVGGHIYEIHGPKATCSCGLAMPITALPMWGTGAWKG